MFIDYNDKRITIYQGHTIASRYGGEWTIKEAETKYPIQLPESDIIEVAANAAIYVSGIAVRSDKRGNEICFKDSFDGGFRMEIFRTSKKNCHSCGKHSDKEAFRIFGSIGY